MLLEFEWMKGGMGEEREGLREEGWGGFGLGFWGRGEGGLG